MRDASSQANVDVGVPPPMALRVNRVNGVFYGSSDRFIIIDDDSQQVHKGTFLYVLRTGEILHVIAEPCRNSRSIVIELERAAGMLSAQSINPGDELYLYPRGRRETK